MGRIQSGTRWTAFAFIPSLSLTLVACIGVGYGGTETDVTPPGASLPASTPEETEVTRLAHDFMGALSTRNTIRLDELLAPQAALFSVRDDSAGPSYAVRSREAFLEGIAGGRVEFLERIWEPVVMVSGPVAMVWAPYDFHLDGAFSHCGIDVLTFLRLEEGWRVTAITYDVVREGCSPSPLGVPGG